MKSTVIIALTSRWEIEHETEEQLTFAKRAIMRDLESNGMGVIEGGPVKAKQLQAVAQEIKP